MCMPIYLHDVQVKSEYQHNWVKAKALKIKELHVKIVKTSFLYTLYILLDFTG